MLAIALAFSLASAPAIACTSSMDDQGRITPTECTTEITPDSVAQPGPTGNSGQPEP